MGAVHEGSVLGVKLFNMTTYNLEDDFLEMERRWLNLPLVPLPPDDEVCDEVNAMFQITTSTPRDDRQFALTCLDDSLISAGGFREDSSSRYRQDYHT